MEFENIFHSSAHLHVLYNWWKYEGIWKLDKGYKKEFWRKKMNGKMSNGTPEWDFE